MLHEFPQEIHVISSDEIENSYLREIRDHLEEHWEVPFAERAQVWVQNSMEEVDLELEGIGENALCAIGRHGYRMWIGPAFWNPASEW